MKRITFIFYCLASALLLLFALDTTGNAGAGFHKIYISPDEQHLYEGTPVTFEIKDSPSHNLKWEFGDGKSVRGGRRETHVFQNPGVFAVKVFDLADPAKPITEQQIRILREDREIIPSSEEIVKGTEVTIETRKFIDKYIKWNFGDGTGDRRGGQTVTHTFTRTGTFKINAVDFDGKDAKEIVKRIRVIPDNRAIELPKEILEGEPFSAAIKNAGGGDYTWEFPGGQKHSGQSLKEILIKNAGTFSVTVKDRSGKYPPLTERITVSPDNRRVEAVETFALPDEDMEFKSIKFKGKAVKWDFGDGTVKQNQSIASMVKHKYKNTGKYMVTAVDFNGKSNKTFKQQVVVGELAPGFNLTLIELAFDDGKYYKVTEKNNMPPSYHVKLKARGRGIVKGKWLLDDTVIGLFETILRENQTAVLDRSDTVKLPVSDQGIHRFTLEFTNYNTTLRIPVIRYFVADTGEIEITRPRHGEKVPSQPSILLEWRLKEWRSSKIAARKDTGDFHYEIAISEIPFQFLEDDRVQWQTAGRKTGFKLDAPAVKSWIYWQVRQVDRGGNIRTTSDIASFRMTGETREKTQKK